MNRSFRRARWLPPAVALLAFAAGGCAKKGERVDGATLGPADQMVTQARDSIAQGDLRKASHALENIQFTVDNRSRLEPNARLAMADATFFQQTDMALIDARALYLDFVTLYGDHPLAPYAQFQAGLCSANQIGHAAKDQTQTRFAIRDLMDVERRYPDSSYAAAARAMIQQARLSLAAHDFQVGRFYLKRKRYVAAEERFRNILKLYPHYPDKESVYFYLAKALLGSENSAEARIYLDKLVTDYPEGEHSREAKQALDRVGGSLDLEVAPGS